MKLVNEKGKLFGIINVVDLLVILLVIAIVAVVGIKLFGTKAQAVVAVKEDCYAEIEIIAASPRLYNEVDRQMDTLIGAKMVTGNEYLNATVEDIWFEDYVVVNPNDEAAMVESVDPNRKDIVFLVKTQVAPDSATLSIGSQELRAGKTFIVKTQTFECSGTIRYVNIGEYDGAGRAYEVQLDGKVK